MFTSPPDYTNLLDYNDPDIDDLMPAACPPPPLDSYPDGPTLAEMEAAIVMGSCAYCGATRPMNELEYVWVVLNGEIISRYFCHERRSSQSWRPICANSYQAGGEG